MRSMGFRSRREFLRTSAAIAAAGILSSHHVAWAAEQDLIVRTAEPYNAEPALIALVADKITPVKHFYVRNHGPLPKVDADGFKVRVEGMVERPLELSLAELKTPSAATPAGRTTRSTTTALRPPTRRTCSRSSTWRVRRSLARANW